MAKLQIPDDSIVQWLWGALWTVDTLVPFLSEFGWCGDVMGIRGAACGCGHVRASVTDATETAERGTGEGERREERGREAELERCRRKIFFLKIFEILRVKGTVSGEFEEKKTKWNETMKKKNEMKRNERNEVKWMALLWGCARVSLNASVAGYLAAPPWGLRYVCLGSPVRVWEFVMCACEFVFFPRRVVWCTRVSFDLSAVFGGASVVAPMSLFGVFDACLGVCDACVWVFIFSVVVVWVLICPRYLAAPPLWIPYLCLSSLMCVWGFVMCACEFLFFRWSSCEF